jgi:ABC-2 type transport system permease protein
MSSLTLPLPIRTRRTALGQIVLNEARLSWRRPIGLIGGIAVPAALTVVFGKLTAFHQPEANLGGLNLFDIYVPILLVLGLSLIALLGLPMPLASYRELGVLRRLATTPAPPSWLLAAQALVQLALALAGAAAVLVLSVVAFGAPVPRSVGGLAVALVLSAAGLFAIGLVVAAAASSATAASVFGRVLYFPLMFLAGLWLPRPEMPHVLLEISNYSPLGAAVEAIQDSVLQGFPPVAPLLVLAAYAAVFGYLAKRFFRWE